MSLVANGCSFTEGYYLDDKTMSWPSCLGKMLNVNVHNLAVGGGSNDRIFRTSVEHLHLAQDTDLLIIGWTGIGRSEIPLHNGSYLKITSGGSATEDMALHSNPSEEYLKDFTTKFYLWHYNKFVWVKSLLCNIITLQMLCEKKKIKLKQFFAFDTTVGSLTVNQQHLVELCEDSYNFFKLENLPFPLIENRDQNIELIQNLIEQIDRSTWIGWPCTTMQDSCKNFEFDQNGHPMDHGHQHWATVIHDSLRQR